ncbi:hypothetical protein QZH41_009966, partial [Actinostola sp. cb2023]
MSGENTETKRKMKSLTWAEASMIVLDRANCHMTHKEILKVIRDENLRDSRNTSSLACLNAMLHHHSRGPDALFYKVDGRNSCYGMNSRFRMSGKPTLKKLTNPGMSASVNVTVNGEAHTTPQIAAARNMVKFSGLHTKKQRRYKKMSVADQIKRTKEGRVDLQSPESILASVPLRSLLNNRTFHLLPPAYQYQLLMLLPKVDRVVGQDSGLRPSSTAFTNEFFTSTCHLWRDRLKDGEFTPEMQQKLKTEEEKLTKIDPWKAKFFEPIWGQ